MDLQKRNTLHFFRCHDHAHDYYNFVSLYVSEKPLHNNSKWSVPKVVADVQYKNFCAGQDWNCVLGFGLHSFREDALTHMLTIAYLDSLFLYESYMLDVYSTTVLFATACTCYITFGLNIYTIHTYNFVTKL